MDIKIIKQDKTTIDIEIENLTIVELLRAYLNKESGIKLAAWKRDHPSKNPVLHLELTSGNPKAVVKKAISAIQKDLDKLVDEFKKAK